MGHFERIRDASQAPNSVSLRTMLGTRSGPALAVSGVPCGRVSVYVQCACAAEMRQRLARRDEESWGVDEGAGSLLSSALPDSQAASGTAG
jgi:hypothetical protein